MTAAPRRSRHRAGGLWRVGGWAAAAMLLGGGCDRPAPLAPATPPTDARANPREAESDVGQSASGEASAEAVSEADLTAILEALTQEVRRYGVERQRVPVNLEELVDQGYLARVPAAPKGRRYVIDKQLRVRLEDE